MKAVCTSVRDRHDRPTIDDAFNEPPFFRMAGTHPVDRAPAQDRDRVSASVKQMVFQSDLPCGLSRLTWIDGRVRFGDWIGSSGNPVTEASSRVRPRLFR